MDGFAFLSAVPLLLIPVAACNVWLATLGGGLQSALASGRLAAPIFTLNTAAGGVWPVSVADLLLAVAVTAFFLDLVKSAASRRWAIVNHALSIVLFVGCLVEILLAPACANSTFFLITLMVLLDVLAGFIVTLAGARADP